MQQVDGRDEPDRSHGELAPINAPKVTSGSRRLRAMSSLSRRAGYVAREFRAAFMFVGCAVAVWAIASAEAAAPIRSGAEHAVDRAATAMGLRVASVVIEGSEGLPDTDVLDAMGLGGARPLPFYDIQAARERLLDIPRLENVTVRKVYPGALHLTLTERQPYALWQNEQDIAVIDRTGRVIRTVPEDTEAELPLFVGEGANDHAESLLVQLVDYPRLSLMVNVAVRVADRRWNLRLDNGMIVRLPEGPEAKAIAILAEMVDEARFIEQPIEVIDLRLSDRITLRLHDDSPVARSGSDQEIPSAPGERRT